MQQGYANHPIWLSTVTDQAVEHHCQIKMVLKSGVTRVKKGKHYQYIKVIKPSLTKVTVEEILMTLAMITYKEIVIWKPWQTCSQKKILG